MSARIIDERDATGLDDSPRYRVYDWMGQEALEGEVTPMIAYELDCLSVWEAIEWLKAERDPRAYLSELYVVDRDGDQVTLLFLGSVSRPDQSRIILGTSRL